jgi:hypothetical protein
MLAYWYRSAELACLGMQQTVSESLQTDEGKSYGAVVLKYHVSKIMYVVYLKLSLATTIQFEIHL